MNILIELKKKIIEKKLLVAFFLNLINKYNELIEQLLICTNIVQAYNFTNIFLSRYFHCLFSSSELQIQFSF